MKRTTDQNRKMWPLLEEVAAQATLNGERYDAKGWKRIFVSFMYIHKGKKPPTITGIGGELVQMYSTSKLEKEDFSDLIEIILWYGARYGVVFHDASN